MGIQVSIIPHNNNNRERPPLGKGKEKGNGKGKEKGKGKGKEKGQEKGKQGHLVKNFSVPRTLALAPPFALLSVPPPCCAPPFRPTHSPPLLGSKQARSLSTIF